MKLRFAAATSLVTAALAACSPTVTGTPASSQPVSDDDQLSALYYEFRDAALSRDTDAFLALICPGLRSTVEPDEWFKDAPRLGDFESTEPFDAPDDGEAAPDATEWRRVLMEPSGHLRVAKIGDTWFACET